MLSITPRAIARGVIDSTTRTHGIHEHCKMYARDGTREKTRDEVEGFFERKKNRGVLSITPRAIARGVIDSTTRTHGIHEHCKMYARDGTREKTRDEVEGFFERKKKPRGAINNHEDTRDK